MYQMAQDLISQTMTLPKGAQPQPNQPMGPESQGINPEAIRAMLEQGGGGMM